MTENIVSFFDILGTSSMVMKGDFSDLHTLDFANPVGIVAAFNAEMRFSVFSDSVIISSPIDKIFEFVSVVSFLFSNWFADGIFVRGGISSGEINWVDDNVTDNIFNQYKNLSYSRIYGQALINAHNVEQKSGAGAICFVDQYASQSIKLIDRKYIIEGYSDMLVWTDKKKTLDLLHFTENFLNKKSDDILAQRQFKATYYYFKNILVNNKYLPDNYLIQF